ncbi:MAG: L-threonylcarbamoyladenylate synthase [Dethiobacteria bacterium]
MTGKWPQKKGTIYLDAGNITRRKQAIDYAVSIIRRGGLVAFPTETVYGLGADALNPQAVLKIYKAKGRPADNPLIVHIARESELEQLVEEIPDDAYRLASKFWPGPLTLILKSTEKVPLETTAGLTTVAIRMPAHPLALELLEATKRPIAAPSANSSGRPSPTMAEHVLADLSGKVDAVIDGGSCRVGLESTVLDLTQKEPLILRPGAVTQEELAACLKKNVNQAVYQGDSPPPSPGMKYRHYAPRAPLFLVNGEKEDAVKAAIAALCQKFRRQGRKVALLVSAEHAPYHEADIIEILGSRDRPAELSRRLFMSLRLLDDTDAEVIIAEGYPEKGLGVALMNRLRKAAGENIICV